jgi:hypothetical protein
MHENYLKAKILRGACVRDKTVLQSTSIAWSETHLNTLLFCKKTFLNNARISSDHKPITGDTRSITKRDLFLIACFSRG